MENELRLNAFNFQADKYGKVLEDQRADLGLSEIEPKMRQLIIIAQDSHTLEEFKENYQREFGKDYEMPNSPVVVEPTANGVKVFVNGEEYEPETTMSGALDTITIEAIKNAKSVEDVDRILASLDDREKAPELANEEHEKTEKLSRIHQAALEGPGM